MEKVQKIKTIENFNEFKYKEKGSVFIGQVYHIESEEKAADILDKVKKKYYDATHHCYAFKLEDEKIKYSDDGEPNGTAGIRILNAIEHFQLSFIIVIVIRYFGGTKLGVGPLGRAYYNSAAGTIENSQIVNKFPYLEVTITAEFSQLSYVHRILSSGNSKILDTIYKNNVTFVCLILPQDVESIKYKLKEISKGGIKVKVNQSIIYR